MVTKVTAAAMAAMTLLAPVIANAATHVTSTETHAFSYPSDVSGGARANGADFGLTQDNNGASSLFAGFDTSLGVLVAANRGFDGTLSLRSNILFDTTIGAASNVFAPGQSAQLSADGKWIDPAGIPTVSHVLSCVADQAGKCFVEKTTTIVADASTRIDNLASLKTYAANDEVQFHDTARYDWDAGTSDQNGLLVVNNYLTLNGAYSLNYEYMDHANASFSPLGNLDMLTLDFGTVAQNSAVGSQLFSLANLGDAYTVGLDLDGFAASGASPFSTNLAAFSDLAAGGQRDFLAYFDSSAQGTFSVDYVLTFSDADVGAGLKTSQLVLRMTGVVGPPSGGCTGRVCGPGASPAPEPTTWAIMVLGFGAAGATLRRRPARNTRPA